MSIVGFIGCSDIQFTAETLATKTGTPTNSCAPILPTYGAPLRISFMVDVSGSTLTTDPNKYYRAQTLDNFITAYSGKSNLNYTYGIFGNSGLLYDNATNAFVSNYKTMFGNASSLQSAVDLFKTRRIIKDETTNYKTGFNALKSNILNDLQQPGSPKAYAVVFMSDGQPKDLTQPLDGSAASLVTEFVQSINSAGGGVRVSSVYFGSPSDQKGIDVLKAIALAGRGQFLDTNVLPNNALNIDDAIAIPGQPCGE